MSGRLWRGSYRLEHVNQSTGARDQQPTQNQYQNPVKHLASILLLLLSAFFFLLECQRLFKSNPHNYIKNQYIH